MRLETALRSTPSPRSQHHNTTEGSPSRGVTPLAQGEPVRDHGSRKTENFGQQYGVRRRQVTHRVKTGRYTHAVKGYRAWRGGRADQQDQDQSE